MSVYKPKGSALYVYDFWFNRVRFSGPTKKKTKRAAEAVEARRKAEVEDAYNNPRKRRPMTLNEAAGRYFEEIATFQASVRTTEYQLANLVQGLGPDALLSAITDNEIAEYVARRRGMVSRRSPKGAEEPIRMAPASVNREVELLRRVFRRAEKTWKVDVGEMPEWGALRLPEPAGRVRELRLDEEARLDTALREDFHPLIQFCVMTGVRKTNAVTLTWPQVDFQARTIAFRVKSRRPGGENHTIPITPALLVLLAQQRGNHPTFVFTYVCKRSRGRRKKGERYPFSAAGWTKEWRKALKAAEIEDYRFHDNRHTAATRTLRASNNLKAVQRMLGHADISTTARYAHALMDDVRAAMEAAHSRESPTAQSENSANPLTGKAVS